MRNIRYISMIAAIVLMTAVNGGVTIAGDAFNDKTTNDKATAIIAKVYENNVIPGDIYEENTEEEEPNEEQKELEVPTDFLKPEEYPLDEDGYYVLTVNEADSTGVLNSREVIQSYLNYAKVNATDEHPIKIVIPKGQYRIDQGFNIYSNTWIYMEGVTLLRYPKIIESKEKVTYTAVFRVGSTNENKTNPVSGYNGHHDIIIDGGIIDGRGDIEGPCFENGVNVGLDGMNSSKKSFIQATHCTNLTIQNVIFKNGYNLHFVEVAGINGFNLLDCTFKGGVYDRETETEAVQFDILDSSERLANFGEYDYTPMKNISVIGCVFDSVQKGIGGHAFTIGMYTENVIIGNNIFKNIDRAAISFENYKNCMISDNVMENVAIGIEFKYMRPLNVISTSSVDKIAVPEDFTKIKINPDAKTVIKNNTMTIMRTKWTASPIAIKIWGENVDETVAKKAGIPAKNYYLKNITIDKNVITTQGDGIILGNTRYSTISNNKITYNGGVLNANFDLVSVNNHSINVTTKNNILIGALRHGISYSDACGYAVVSDNTIKSCKGKGIRVYKCDRQNKIKNNKVYGNGEGGIAIERCDGTITGNAVKNTGKHGITIAYGIANISNNKVNYTYRGIVVDIESRAKVQGNTVLNSTKEGIYVAESTLKTTLYDNIIRKAGSGHIGVVSRNENKMVKLNQLNQPIVSDVKVMKKKIQVKAKKNINAKKYIFYRKEGKGEYKKIATTSKNMYVDKKVKKGRKYRYKVVIYTTVGKVCIKSCMGAESKQVKAE